MAEHIADHMADHTTTPRTAAIPTQGGEPSTAELLTRLSDQSGRLVRDELALLRLELNGKIRRFGRGAVLFSAAGVLAWFGFGALGAAAVLALALALPAWLAALVVTAVLLAGAGVAALVGKKQVDRGMPPAPEHTIDNVQQDVQTVQRTFREGRR
jgi:hypothetical protein